MAKLTCIYRKLMIVKELSTTSTAEEKDKVRLLLKAEYIYLDESYEEMER